ncbi:phosphoglycolate phosphatase [Lachnospiraceae bacterium XBB1006]|nr:phosphoglycolate phosphatase [Lachnospiraceae bacterium XBB1006]
MVTYLFDLDGTLVDTCEGIYRGIKFTEKRLKLPSISSESLRQFLGPPLSESFRKYYNLEETAVEEAVTIFREYYGKYGIFECEPYPGIKEMLEKLHEQKIRLFVATSKPTGFAKEILTRFGMDIFFEDIIGSETNGQRNNKVAVIEYIIEKYMGTWVNEDVYMIGDRDQDILAAAKVGIHSIGVLYGYGELEELEKASSEFIIKTSRDLEKLLLRVYR